MRNEYGDDDERPIRSHQPCSACGSSDALAVYSDHTYCFSCTNHKFTKPRNAKQNQGGSNVTQLNTELTKGLYGTIKDRRIKKDVCKKFGVKLVVNKEKTPVKHVYPYHNSDGAHVANKVRRVADKSQMPWEGTPRQTCLFGQHLWKAKKKEIITITEGELDCLAAYQMFGEQYPVVSVPNGAKGALRDCKKHYDFLDQYKKIYICFDNDKQGKEAAAEVALLFHGKAYVVEFDKDYNDPCDYLVDGKEKEFLQAWWSADPYVPSEILTGQSLLDLLDSEEDQECFDLPWQGLNDVTYGYRMGETWAIVAHAKIGKTYVIREMLHHILHTHTDHKVGTIFLEGLPREHMKGFASLEADIPFHLPNAEYTDKDYADAKEKIPVDRLCLYQREGVLDVESILNVIKYYVKAMDCNIVVLDNLMALVSDQPTDQERSLLNTTITKAVKLAEDMGVLVILVAHLNRNNQIHGTSLLEKQANIVLELRRDKMADSVEERNTTQVFVTENRFSGETGLACELLYHKSTGRMSEIDREDELEQDTTTPTLKGDVT